jgi:hypothetical protein
MSGMVYGIEGLNYFTPQHKQYQQFLALTKLIKACVLITASLPDNETRMMKIE